MQCPSCGTAVRAGQKFCMECGSSLRGVADDTGEVPVIRSQTPPPGARDEVTQAMGRLSSRDDDRPTGTAGFPPPATAGATAAAGPPTAPGADPLLRGSDAAGAPSTEERFYGGRQPWSGGDPERHGTDRPDGGPHDRPARAADPTYAYGAGVVTDERDVRLRRRRRVA